MYSSTIMMSLCLIIFNSIDNIPLFKYMNLKFITTLLELTLRSSNSDELTFDLSSLTFTKVI